MPQCAVKKCKNNSKKVKKGDGISYFHFPVNLLLKEKWRKMIAEERREEFYRPNKSSVVCSDHFSESDMYYTAKGIRRLKRDAVPVVDINEELEQINNVADSVKTEDPLSSVFTGTPLSIFSTEVETNSKAEVDIKEELEQINNVADSVKTEDRGGASPSIFPTEDETNSKSKVDNNETFEQIKNVADSVKTEDRRGTPLSIFPIEVETSSKSMASISTAKRKISPESSSLRTSKKAALTPIPNITSEQRDIPSPTSSDCSCFSNTPITSYFKKSLRESNKKVQVKTKLVKKLQQQNRRLTKRNHRLKSIIQELKKKRLRGEGLSNDLQPNNDPSNILSVLTAKKKMKFSQYTPAFRKFALTLNSYSPAAYKYLRGIFNNRLPHPNTMFIWHKNVNAKLGSTTDEAIPRLSDQAKTSTELLRQTNTDQIQTPTSKK